MLITTGRGAERAARAIVELINSRPFSPRQDEIVAIIKKLAVEATMPAPGAAPPRDGLDQYGPDLTKHAP
jgi:hypothetical protein